jgi:hypothetical protein
VAQLTDEMDDAFHTVAERAGIWDRRGNVISSERCKSW